MKRIQKLLSMILVTCLLVSMIPAASAAGETGRFASVSVQENTATVRLLAKKNCTLFVAQYGEDGQMLGISTAEVMWKFNYETGDYDYQTFAVPLEETEEDYDLKVFLLDNTTRAPLCDSYVMKNAGTAGEHYAIIGLDAEAEAIVATVTTEEACTMEVQFWDQTESELIFTTTADAAAGLDFEYVSAEYPGYIEYDSLPGYFVMRAVLKDEEGNAVSNPYTNRRNTEAFQTFAAQTEADFRDRTDVNFLEVGEADDGNFVVMNGDVTYLSDSSSVNVFSGESDGVLTFENAGENLTSLAEGALIAFVNGAGEYETVKIKEITVKDSIVSVTRDETASLSDFYEVIKLNADLTYEGEDETSEVAALSAAVEDPTAQLLKVEFGPALKTNFDLSIVSAEGKIRAGGKVSVNYDPKMLGDDYMDMTLVACVKGEMDITVGAAKNWKDDITIGSIPLAGLKEVLGASLNVELVCQIDAEIGYNFTLEFENAYGFVYSTDTSLQVLRKSEANQKEASSESKIKGEIEAEIGVRGELSVSLLNELIEASVGAEGGLAVTGELEILSGTLPSGLDSYHACGLCMNGDCKSYFEVDVTLDYEINAWLKGNLADLDIVRTETTIGSFYLSLLNDEDSIHGGKVKFEWADSCPNKKYKVTLKTYDAGGNEVADCAVTVFNSAGETVETVTSPGKLHLYPGDYTAAATIAQNYVEKKFTLGSGIMTVNLNGVDKVVSGYVTNLYNGEALSGATVQINKDGTAIYSATADADGWYSLTLPDGEYTVAFKADGYETKVVKLSLDGDKVLNGNLESVAYNVSFDANGGSGSMDPMEFRYGQSITLPEAAFTPPEGKSFKCWLVGEVQCAAGTNYMPDAGDHTVKAVWEDEMFTVTVSVQYEDGYDSSIVLSLEGTGLKYAPYIYGSDGITELDLPGGTYHLTIMNSVEGYYAAQTLELDQDTEITLILKKMELNWSLDETTGLLTVTGWGPMPDYDTYDGIYAPWYEQIDKILSADVSGVTTIGDEAFSGCYNMSSVNISEDVSSISWYAFQNCIRLTDIDIPDSVTTIESGVFHRTGLKQISLPDSVTTLGDGVFRECENLITAAMPQGIEAVGSQQFYLCENLKCVTIPDSVTVIYDYAFGRCSALTSITLPDGLTTIEEYAFEYCPALKEITIPDSVTNIGKYAFSYCTALTSVRIPGSVTEWGDWEYWVFYGCENLKTAVFEDGVLKVPNHCFADCTALTSVTIPASVTAIDKGAFSGCTALTDIYFSGTQEQWEAITFGTDNAPLASATIHCNGTVE